MLMPLVAMNRLDESRLRKAPAGNAGETVAIATILTMVRKLDQNT